MTSQAASSRLHQVDGRADQLDDEFRRASHLLLDLHRFTERVRAADGNDERLERLDTALLGIRRLLDGLLSLAAR